MHHLQPILNLIPLLYSFLAQHGSSTTVNPYTKPDDIASGAALYLKQCAGCHGPNGQGAGAGPALNTGAFRHGSTDEALFQTISKGVPGTTMPAFALSGLQTWQLVTHLRQLSLAGRTTKATGNATAGQSLFKSFCLNCHGNNTNSNGPDLTGIGARASLAELRQSILQPSDTVPPEFWRVQLTLSSGQTTTGTRLNEDTHSIQLRDRDNRLQTFPKSQITKLDWLRTSPMPAFANRLTPTQIEDLIAYLASTPGEKQ